MSTAHRAAVSVAIFAGIFGTATAQEIQVSRSNKTIEITATESVRLDPEFAVIEVGYHNRAQTQETAYEQNVRMAQRIIKSILDTQVPKEEIETQSVRLGRPERYGYPESEHKGGPEFEAIQSWNIRVPVSRAQAVVDAAVRAGANEIEDLSWDVTDPGAVQVKAISAAMAKARALAERMVARMGVKLGELLYASNTAQRLKEWPFTVNVEASTATARVSEAKLKLFPKKVEQQATVRAIFAIE